MDEFDRACSRFRADSELSAVNAPPGSAVRVGPVLLEAVSAALRAARLTGGRRRPDGGRGVDRARLRPHFEAVAARAGACVLGPLASVPGWRTVTSIPSAARSGSLRGVSLDLGATAKALAADRAAAAALDAAGCGVLVSFGGDLAIAGPAPAEGWRVRVTDDHRAGVSAPGQWITVRAGGLATSSTAVRRWRTDAGVAHHLVDPSTGRSGRQRVANGQRVRRLVPGREHRQHGGDRPRRAGGRLARVARAAEPAGARRRDGAARRRLAVVR